MFSGLNRLPSIIRAFIILLLLLPAAAALLAGCDQLTFLDQLELPDLFGQTDPTVSAPPLLNPTQTPANTPQVFPTPITPQKLTLWVPPQFDPGSDTKAAALLKERLDSFSAQNPNVQILVRVKAASGAGGLFESLAAASAAAPQAVPSLIALQRSDLEAAALKGLIYPLNGLSTSIDDPDWYAYARQLALIQGSTFGLPFAGDALLIIYRPEKIGPTPSSWDTILSRGLALAFPAADPQALLTLSLYRSTGGTLEDAQRRPMLDPDSLTQVLDLYASGAKQGAFPPWMSQYQTDSQAWQTFNEGRAHWVITWSSRYLSSLPADAAAIPLPSLNPTPSTLATGWMWALSDPIPERRALSVKLAEHLESADFLSEWTAAAGYLPTRPSALAAWSDQNLQTLLTQIVLSAQVRPPNDIVASLGPVLQEAGLKVIRDQANPADTAIDAVRKISTPEAK